MNTKTYLMIGVAGVILLGGYFLLQGQYQPTTVPAGTVTPTTEAVYPSPTAVKAEATAATASGKVMEKALNVDYLDSGFSPKTVTVKVGATVSWTNKSAKQVWVASVVHPTHQVYPGFDQLTSVGKGETYSFTFGKIGSWKYHNHLSPSDTGTIVVE